MMHEARADLTMLLGSIYLVIEGAGRWSVDAWLGRHNAERKPLPMPRDSGALVGYRQHPSG